MDNVWTLTYFGQTLYSDKLWTKFGCGQSLYRVVQKMSARLHELAPVLGASSHNLTDFILDNPVHGIS